MDLLLNTKNRHSRSNTRTKQKKLLSYARGYARPASETSRRITSMFRMYGSRPYTARLKRTLAYPPMLPITCFPLTLPGKIPSSTLSTNLVSHCNTDCIYRSRIREQNIQVRRTETGMMCSLSLFCALLILIWGTMCLCSIQSSSRTLHLVVDTVHDSC